MASSVNGVTSMPSTFYLGRRPSFTAPPTEYVSIAEYYADRSIFVTGGTGFMGKVLVEKLLRSCPNIKNIYLLMRPKRGQDANSRYQELIASPLFDTLRQNRPQDLNKIVPIVGDITEAELGISAKDQAMLCQKVSVVFHSAATVKFDEKLKLSVAINMLGTQQLVQLCHRMVHLEALVHVSTAYCNTTRSVIHERVYPPPAPPHGVVSLVSWMSDDAINHVTPHLIGDRPNTYTYTKALAEVMLTKERGNLPVAIVRPSIEPVEGWVDNWNGPNGIIAAAGKGVFRTMRGTRDKIADLVPVDIVINLMIAAAWNKALYKGESVGCTDGISVFNCCTGQQNPITWGQFVDKCFVNLRKNPFSDLSWYPGGSVVSSSLHNRIMSYVYHTIPAYIIDTISILLGRKPIMVKVQDKLVKASACLEYFTTNQWCFIDTNVQTLYNNLSQEDRKLFDFDIKNINWDAYIEHYILGIRKFMFKESPGSLPKSRRHLNRLYVLHVVSQFFAILLVWRFIFQRSRRLRDLWCHVIASIQQLLRLIATTA